ncbi:aldo/keto reductase [Pelagicoccus mobilis]|uniref:Aldo/keto reductase n=1 Tax=Pelagicoccus mobilis TaxID=415221 RepID=A0A934RZX2_9BACT|nr:aldo/keto reductase [Pelagicoccus mobilis]
MSLALPKIVFGSSALGNLYEAVPYERKLEIVRNWVSYQPEKVVIDSAGKYGAGLSLECIGKCLKELEVEPSRVLISNKLGWKRIPLRAEEVQFEKGVWVGLENDAVQDLSYDGIMECYEQGNELLGDYDARLLSVHDPDEYLESANTPEEVEGCYAQILESYRALADLRLAGKASGIGVGSKDWKTVKRLYEDGVPLDWVMLANSFTLLTHSQEVIDFIDTLHRAGVVVINSAVFNAGFLIGGDWYNYRKVTPEEHPGLFEWRKRFMDLCTEFGISPAEACCQFALSPPGIVSLALNTSKPGRVADNVSLVSANVPSAFWRALKDNELLDPGYPYL